jgi:hypothetical protein
MTKTALKHTASKLQDIEKKKKEKKNRNNASTVNRQR